MRCEMGTEISRWTQNIGDSSGNIFPYGMLEIEWTVKVTFEFVDCIQVAWDKVPWRWRVFGFHESQGISWEVEIKKHLVPRTQLDSVECLSHTNPTFYTRFNFYISYVTNIVLCVFWHSCVLDVWTHEAILFTLNSIGGSGQSSCWTIQGWCCLLPWSWVISTLINIMKAVYVTYGTQGNRFN
jgi:hypothetical protein